MKTVYRLVLRTQVGRGRVLALGALGALVIVLAIAVRADSNTVPSEGMFSAIDGLGLGVVAPVVALVFASAALGDLAEDRTLVYVWLRPLERWRLALGSLLATLSVVVPFVLVPLLAGVLVAGGGTRLLGATALAGSVAVVGYSTIFLALGLRVRRALVWGLAYVLVWEGAVSRVARGAARVSVQVYARSLLATFAGQTAPKNGASSVLSVAVPLVVAVLAFLLTVRWLQNADVA